MSLPLNLLIDRTADGKLRAEIAGHPESAVEASDLTGLLNAVQGAFLQFLTADPRESARDVQEMVPPHPVVPLSDLGDTLPDDEDKVLGRIAVERMPDPEMLRKMVARHPVPDDWPEGDEDWDDVP